MDLSETPAVAPMETGGDERIGLFLAGAVLLVVGWGFAVLLNLLLHAQAPDSGLPLGPVRVFRSLGGYAWLTLGLGLFTGAIGAAFVVLARSTAKGPFVLPGQPY